MSINKALPHRCTRDHQIFIYKLLDDVSMKEDGCRQYLRLSAEYRQYLGWILVLWPDTYRDKRVLRDGDVTLIPARAAWSLGWIHGLGALFLRCAVNPREGCVARLATEGGNAWVS
ncbi:hypothetical protein L484_020740 [Morus notabilis]|uniref:Uncharacterized protein n=1 Tax=Morus notabilis TaxID=981085 RepID=W9QM28_9ROSA|nr:hypothetical protein L484_020740 [Morus notabilis]